MSQSRFSKALLITFSIIFIMLGVYLLQQNSITLPGRLTMNQYVIEYSGIVFFAGSLFTLSLMLILLTLNAERFKKICTNIFLVSFALFSIGFFV